MKTIQFFLIGLISCIGFTSAGTIVMTTSDYSTGNTSVLDIETGEFADNVLPHFQDARVKSDGTNLYIIEGFGADAVSKYDESAISTGKALYQYSTGPGTNPQDMVFAGSKAFVILNSTGKILVVDPNAADETSFVTGEIDISQWADGDGSPDALIGYEYEGLVYVVLQRYDVTQYAANTPVLIIIDPATDTLIDMDDTVEGIQGIDLMVNNPRGGSLFGSKLYIAGTTFGASDEGVMVIDLADPLNSQQVLLRESDLGSTVTDVDVFSNELAIVYTFDADWNTIGVFANPATMTLGEALPLSDTAGGAVYVDGLLYIGSRDFEKPGLYVFNPFSSDSEAISQFFPTELPPYSITYIGEEIATAIADDYEVPGTFTLEAPYPNPFNPSTTVIFTLTQSSVVTIDVFNAVGQKVDTILNATRVTGRHSAVWNAKSMPAGMYFIRVDDSNSMLTERVMLMK
ncbi:T9SS type A sorting domain-containing protein [Candidatus Latescibacterota bacterium]